MLLHSRPPASFAAVADGRVVGTAIGIDYGRFGWIAMMLVDPAYRGRGLGARLLERAMTALPPTCPSGSMRRRWAVRSTNGLASRTRRC